MTTAKQLLNETTTQANDTAASDGFKPHEQLPVCLVPADQILPRRYVMHRHSQACTNCGRVHEWVNMYAFNEMMSRTGAGKMVVHLVPVNEIRYNLPIERVQVPEKTVPVCHECVNDIQLTHLIDPRNLDEWRRRYNVVLLSMDSIRNSPLHPDLQDKAKKPAKPASGKKPRSIDDLI